ncbi:MAG: hypothetical protein AAGF13_05920, partial [Pseudomonadota bacterium]
PQGFGEDQPIADEFEIAGLLDIEEEVQNPLAEAGGGAPEPDLLPEPDLFAGLVAPAETSQPQPLAPEPALPDVVIPDAVASEVTTPDVSEPVDIAPEVAEPEITEPEITEDEQIAALPDIVETPPEEPEPPITEDVVEEPPVEDPPAAPTPQLIANPSESDLAIGTLLRRIRSTPDIQCTLALPRRAATGAGLSMIGADEAELDQLAAQITDGLEIALAQSRELIDDRQCATLDILRRADSYPASRLGLSLDATSYASGDTLSGRVLGGQGLFLTLLLIDDNGVVQDLGPFTRLDGLTPVFEAPIARAGGPRDTRQLIVAIGTRGAPLDLGGRVGQLAEDVFAPLPGETMENMVFGVASIDVR